MPSGSHRTSSPRLRLRRRRSLPTYKMGGGESSFKKKSGVMGRGVQGNPIHQPRGYYHGEESKQRDFDRGCTGQSAELARRSRVHGSRPQRRAHAQSRRHARSNAGQVNQGSKNTLTGGRGGSKRIQAS